MGCFSYLCYECHQGINSDSMTGEQCRLYALEKGKIIEERRGMYDSYGRVLGEPWSDMDRFLDLHWDEDPLSGFAAVHERCYRGREPRKACESDPNQGWGDYKLEDGQLVVGLGL